MEKKNKQNPKSLPVVDRMSNPQKTNAGKPDVQKQKPNAPAGKPYFEVVDSVRNNPGDQSGYQLTDAQKKLLEVQGAAIDLLFKAHNSMIELAAVRLQCKLSNTRVSGVAKELKELIKVMSVYDC